MLSPVLDSESDILLKFNVDEAHKCVVRWLQNSSIAQYYEDHPDAWGAIVTAGRRLPQSEILFTPASTPCYTNLSNQQAPTPLTFQCNTEQSQLINNVDADSPEAELNSCGSQSSTDLDDSSTLDQNNEIYNQDTIQGDQLSRRDVASHQTGIQPAYSLSRHSKRPHVEDVDETSVDLESGGSQYSVSLENQSTPDKNGKPTSQQLGGSNVGQGDQASKPTVASATLSRQVAKLPHRRPKSNLPIPMDYIHNEKDNAYTELDPELRSKIQRIADVETLTWAWEFFSFMRNPILHVNDEANQHFPRKTGSPNTVTTSDQRLRELRECIERDEETEKSIRFSKRMVGISKRLHLAELIARYIEERDAWKSTKTKRRKPNETELSPMNRFVDILFPETIKYKVKNVTAEKEKRHEAKEKFERWIQCGEPWARMALRYGYGIIILVPKKLSNEDLRRLRRPHIDTFLDYIEFTRPGLKDQLSHLSILLLSVVNHGILPPQRLVLETLPSSRLSELGDRTLEELLQHCTEEPNTIESTQRLPQYHTEDQDAIDPAQGTVSDCPLEDPDQLFSPLTRMYGQNPSDSAVDISEYVHSLPPDALWAGDCEFRPNTAAIEAKNNIILNSKEQCYLSQASRLDNEFLLSPAVIYQSLLKKSQLLLD